MAKSRTDVETESIASPCINVCTLDRARNYCTGCYRSLDEIAAWSRVDNAQRQAIVVASAQRRQQMGKVR